MRFAETSTLLKRREFQIVRLDGHTRGDVIANEIEPRELLRRESYSGFRFVHQPFVKTFGHGIGERLEHRLLFQCESDEWHQIGKTVDRGSALYFFRRLAFKRAPQLCLAPRPVLCATFFS